MGLCTEIDNYVAHYISPTNKKDFLNYIIES